MVGLGIGCLDGASGRAGHWLSVWMGSVVGLDIGWLMGPVVGLGIGCLDGVSGRAGYWVSGWGQW